MSHSSWAPIVRSPGILYLCIYVDVACPAVFQHQERSSFVVATLSSTGSTKVPGLTRLEVVALLRYYANYYDLAGLVLASTSRFFSSVSWVSRYPFCFFPGADLVNTFMLCTLMLRTLELLSSHISE
jgi:hypothetical protein